MICNAAGWKVLGKSVRISKIPKGITGERMIQRPRIYRQRVEQMRYTQPLTNQTTTTEREEFLNLEVHNARFTMALFKGANHKIDYPRGLTNIDHLSKM